MTNKETIIWLEGMKEGVFPWSDEVMNEVCDTAISALSVPKGEYINKFVVLTEMDKRHAEGDFITKGFINSLPTISVPEREKGEWIPVSERLPEEDGDYILWGKVTEFDEEEYQFIGGYDSGCEKFGVWEEQYDRTTLGCLGSEFFEYNRVLAWQPLPEPYKENDTWT